MLWVDKYRPLSLDKMDYHKDISDNLKQMVASGDFPHILLYGPSGAGKKTRTMALLREVFGSGVEKLKVEHRIFKFANTSATAELTTISSNYHIEINPSDAGFHDRHVVQELIKEIAQSQPLPVAGSKDRGFKVVVLNEVDRLSKEAQHALRRTMEKYMATCRIVLICNSASKVIDPIRSRCLMLRLASPTHDEICQVLQFIAHKEKLALPPTLAAKIAQASDRNLRRAILMMEACKVQQYPFSEDQAVALFDWERFISEIARDILEEQSTKRLMQVRSKLYELLTNCIPPDLLMKRLLIEIMRALDSSLKQEVAHWAAFYEHRLQTGSKAIIHLEAFCAKVMSIYKRFIVSIDFGDM